MAGHAQLKFVMTECSKTQIRLTGLISRTSPYRKLQVSELVLKVKVAPLNSTAIVSLPLVQEGQLSVTGERMGTKYW